MIPAVQFVLVDVQLYERVLYGLTASLHTIHPVALREPMLKYTKPHTNMLLRHSTPFNAGNYPFPPLPSVQHSPHPPPRPPPLTRPEGCLGHALAGVVARRVAALLIRHLAQLQGVGPGALRTHQRDLEVPGGGGGEGGRGEGRLSQGEVEVLLDGGVGAPHTVWEAHAPAARAQGEGYRAPGCNVTDTGTRL
jgi:hypothetical protein